MSFDPLGVVLPSGSEFIPSKDADNALMIGSDKKPFVKDLSKELEDLKLFKFPNTTIIGQPTINNGQISNFSSNDYLQFPFIVDFKNREFVINIEFSTGENVTTQQNIFDSDFGLAFAIRNSHLVIALSSNGYTWDLGELVGNLNILPQQTYKIRILWDKSVYKVEYSIDGGENWVTDIIKESEKSLYPKQIFIGVGENYGSVMNYFQGSINLNYCNLTISDELVWQGMDDVGIATRLAVDMSNLDFAGIERIKQIVDGEIKTSNMTFVNINATFIYDGVISDYPYTATINLDGVTSHYIPTINLSLEDATNDSISPVAESGDGFIKIHSRESKSILIPSIICTKIN